MMSGALALDIGGSKLAAALVDHDGALSGRSLAPSPSQAGPEAMLDAAAELVRRVVNKVGTEAGVIGGIRSTGQEPSVEPLVSLGVAAAGVVDTELGTIISAVDSIKGWGGTPLASLLAERTGLSVVVENDVNAIAIAETRAGTARGARSALVASIGTGIGGALILDGGLYRGSFHGAGELGHLPVDVFGEGRSYGVCNCGRFGHLESISSGPAITREYSRRASLGVQTGPRPEQKITLEDVGRACAQGDAAALEVVRSAARVLGRTLGGLANVFDPEVVVLAGGVLGLGQILFQPVVEAFHNETLSAPSQITVVKSEFGSDAGLVGAGLNALEHQQRVRQPVAQMSSQTSTGEGSGK